MAETPLSDEELQFYRDRGIECELQEGEYASAVIWFEGSVVNQMAVDEAEAVRRRLGEALKKWKESQPRVRRILGLPQMLDGRFPEIATFLVWGRYYPHQIEPMAMVTSQTGELDKDFATYKAFWSAEADLVASLKNVVPEDIAKCMSCGDYTYQYR